MNLTLGGRGRRRSALIAVLAVGILAAVVVAAKSWQDRKLEDRRARTAAAAVWVDWTPSCPEGLITYPGEDDSDMFAGPIILSRGQWRCTIDLVVYNDSKRDLHVSRINAPFVGTHAAAEMIGYSTDDAKIHDSPSGIDAVYTVDLDVPAGERGRIRLEIGRRPEVCNGGTFGFPHWPDVRFEQSGRTFSALTDPDLQISAFQNRENAAFCDDPQAEDD